jgi:hypothetical protein
MKALSYIQDTLRRLMVARFPVSLSFSPHFLIDKTSY